LQIVIHDAQTGEVLNTLEVDTIPVGQSASSRYPAYYVYPVFRPGGGQMAALIRPSSRAQNPRQRQLMAWDLATGKQLFSVPINASNTSGFYGLRYSQDGASLVMMADDRPEATVVLYDPTTGVRQRSIFVPSSSDRNFLNVLYQMFGNFVGSEAAFWDLATGQEYRGPPRHNPSNRYAISPDGSRLVLGKRPMSTYSGESEFILWSLVSGTRLLEFKREGFVEAISFSPDGNRLVAAFSHIGPSPLKPIQIWDATPLPEKP
jgi:WD40 repeat protein